VDFDKEGDVKTLNERLRAAKLPVIKLESE